MQNLISKVLGWNPPPESLDIAYDEDGGLDDALSDQSTHKAHRINPDWLVEGEQEYNWSRIMMSVLSLTVSRE